MYPFEGIPEILYKYRIWEGPEDKNPYQKRILTHNEIYLASAIQFNDPFDSFLPFKYKEEELTRKNIYNKLIQMAIAKWPDLTQKQLKKLAKERMRSDDFITGNYWKKPYPKFKEDVAQKYGIVSLTSKPSNLLMWSHYASSHQGLCIGFDTVLLYKSIGGNLGKILYSEKFPEIGLFDDFPTIAQIVLNTKSRDWEYEDEYRIRRFNAAKSIVTIPSECIRQIILGNKMDDAKKKEIIELQKSKFSHAKIYQAEISINEFKVDLIEI